MARPKLRTRVTKVLNGTKFGGRTIRTVQKVQGKPGTRNLLFNDGSTQVVQKRTVASLADVTTDLEYRKLAQETLIRHKDGTASIKLGGPKEGTRKFYVNEAGAKRAMKRYYHADFEKYQKGIKARDCRRKPNK